MTFLIGPATILVILLFVGALLVLMAYYPIGFLLAIWVVALVQSTLLSQLAVAMGMDVDHDGKFDRLDVVTAVAKTGLGKFLGFEKLLARMLREEARKAAAGALVPRRNATTAYATDGPEAVAIAKSIPYYPFKGLPRFYDIGGFLERPVVFQQIVDIFVARYRTLDVDSIGGLDARGFVLGPPIALALNKPFFMLRKSGKMPNTLSSKPYKVEYGQRDGLCIPRNAVKKGDRVLLIDDLVATGGTLSAGIECVKMCGGNVVECACIVELTFLVEQRQKFYDSLGIGDVPIWALISDKILQTEAKLPPGYKDDGEEH
mmetsp:Transcript_58931/g.133428  ORF Transcript_58931/g.133428 Transcript_58931/m.133428 type:complete len:317 (+) Transcript_58931:121-1071(+)